MRSLVFALVVPTLLQAQSLEVVSGRVRADSTTPLAGAKVVVQMAPDRATDSTRTDADGRWQLSFANGTGDYLARITRVGYKPLRARLRRSADAAAIVLDTVLDAIGQKLERVVVSSERPTAEPAQVFGRGSGGDADDMAIGITGALTPDLAGNLNALAGTIPGMIAGASGPSALGLDASQNQTRLNGSSFGGSMPSCAGPFTRVATSTLDPGRGGFSGAQIDADMSPGYIFSNRSLRITADGPPTQLNDPVSRATGAAPTRVDACLGAQGELAYERWFYNTALQVNRRVADVSDLFSADQSLLSGAGVASDSAARLYGSLRSAGIPVQGTIAGTASTDVTFLGRFDHGKPREGQSQGVLVAASFGQDKGLGLSMRNVGTGTAQQSRADGMLQGNATWRFRTDWLNEFRSALSWSHKTTTPDFLLPQGRVLVGGALSDGTATVTPVGFGGSAFANATNDLVSWETMNETQRISGARGAHRLKLTALMRVDALRTLTTDNGLGTFTYTSLADLSADRPSSFSRTLFAPEARAGQFSGALALGDAWRVTRSLRVQLGARAEVNSWLMRAIDNPAVTSTFGARTTEAPNRFHVSPRLGFEWAYGGSGTGISFSNAAMWLVMPGGALRGGIGEFRNTLPTSLLTSVRQNTGLPSGEQRVACYGSDVPARDWIGWGSNTTSLPASCVSGGGLLADGAPAVQLFSPDYEPQRSWRGHLEWQTPIPGFMMTVRGTYSLNLNQPSGVDLNFVPTERFALADEGFRSVWVPTASITPATGAVSPVGARASSAFGPVWMRTSDLESRSKQVLVTLTPRGYGLVFVKLDYAWNDVQQQFRGFDGAGAGNPNVVEWARGTNDVRHVVQAQLATSFRNVALTMRAWGQSGRPFTPIVNGDITGTGLGGERAFVFNPGAAADTSVANGMRSFLATAPSFAQSCLVAQMGTISTRNSCEGPWTGGLNVTLAYTGRIPGFGENSQIQLTAGNVLSGIDQLANGSANLQGWGLAIPPDPVLLTVRGFDPVARRYSYAVNQRFGSVSPLQSLVRAPMAIMLHVRLDIAPAIPRQQIDRWLRPGRGNVPGPKLSADSLLVNYRRGILDPYLAILEESDSLLLTNTQVAKLREHQRVYATRVDSLWRPLVESMAALPDEFDVDETLRRQEVLTDDSWELGRLDVREFLPQILTTVQLTLLPWPAGYLMSQDKPRKGPRIYYY